MPRAFMRLSRICLAGALIWAPMTSAGAAPSGYLKLGDIKGEAQDKKGKNWFVADSFSFGVEREMKESGEKAGTEDINIGVGELQEATISKSMDASSPSKSKDRPMSWDNTKHQKGSAKAHGKRTTWVAHSSPAPSGSVRVKMKMPWMDCRVGARYPMVELGQGEKVYRLHDVRVASCGGDADDRPTEEVAFYYNKIQ